MTLLPSLPQCVLRFARLYTAVFQLRGLDDLPRATWPPHAAALKDQTLELFFERFSKISK